MPTVRDVTFDLLRELEMTTVFGNPGSSEEPFLTEFPDDFQYILGLHEAAVVAMADGFAQASGNAAFVNLHTASGVGNGMGALFTAWHNRTPLVMTAGQQTRQMLALEPWLVRPGSDRVAAPVRQVEPRTGAGGGRPRSHRAGLPHRHGAATRSRLRLDSNG